MQPEINNTNNKIPKMIQNSGCDKRNKINEKRKNSNKKYMQPFTHPMTINPPVRTVVASTKK